MRHGFPIARPGERIGLLGGSFDPAHEGHVHLSHVALTRFGLDRLWWLVSPGNPLKPDPPQPLGARMDRAREVMAHPSVEITALEAALGTRYTAATLGALLPLYPGVRFTWVGGADILDEFHRWRDWRGIAQAVRLGFIARPGQRLAARTSPAARILRPWRLPAAQSTALGGTPAPAWCFVNAPMVAANSSALRAGGEWPIRGATD